MPRPRRPAASPDSRARILAAAAAEFADRGFAGAGVDRIARRARVNKAMIYYHFKSKAALYRNVIHEMVRTTGERVRAILAGPGTSIDKIRAFADAVVEEADRRPHFPRIMMREMAEQGRHLDKETFALIQGLPRAMRLIVHEHDGPSPRPDPQLVYFSLIGPLLFYMGSGPVRARMARQGLPEMDGPDLAGFARHLRDLASALLTGLPAAPHRPASAHVED